MSTERKTFRSPFRSSIMYPPSAEVCYTVDDTVAALDGLEVNTAEVAERTVDTPDGPRTALDTLVIAQRPT